MNENDKGSNNRNSSRRRTKEFTFENEQEEEEQGRGLQKTTDRWGFLRSKLKKRPTNDDEDGTVDGEDGNLTDVDENESYKMCDCIEKTKPERGVSSSSSKKLPVGLLSLIDAKIFLIDYNIIPFKTVYDPLDEVPVEDRVYFVPGVPVKATIVAARRDTDHHQGQIWYVERKYVDFQRLANRLALFKATQVVSAPFSWHRSAESPSASGQHLPKCIAIFWNAPHFSQDNLEKNQDVVLKKLR
uniref:PX domain-containing protein n=1 Tax=Romanomermis culicivorax TaxID=13658 RepID=A0A915KFY0_ROMCU